MPRSVVNCTVSPWSGFPFKVTREVIVEVIVEPAATIVGFAVSVSVPSAIVTFIDLETVPQEAVTVATPRLVPGDSLTVATPTVFVVAVRELSVPKVVAKFTITSGARRPVMSRTVTVIAEVIAEPAARTVGLAEIII